MPKVHAYPTKNAEDSWAKSPVTSWTTEVMLASEDDKAVIYYTLDGSEPTTSSSVYTKYIVVGGARLDQASRITVVKYAAGRAGGPITQEGGMLMCIFSRPMQLVSSLASGCWGKDNEIHLVARPESKIYYTLDGLCPLTDQGTPAPSAIKYTEAIPVGDFTLTAVAVSHDGNTYSCLLTSTYTIAKEMLAISASHKEGAYSEPIAVRLESNGGPDVLIKYTLDGSCPATANTAIIYDTPVILGNCDKRSTLRAVAMTEDQESNELTRIYKFEE